MGHNMVTSCPGSFCPLSSEGAADRPHLYLKGGSIWPSGKVFFLMSDLWGSGHPGENVPTPPLMWKADMGAGSLQDFGALPYLTVQFPEEFK